MMNKRSEDIMRRVIATPSRTKELLHQYQLSAKKNYGQNFLVEPGIVDKIARSAIVSDHCVVFEIGPGIGALTQFLCEYAQHVVAFEIDERLPKVLEESLSDYDNFSLIMNDFLEVDIKAYTDKVREAGYDVAVAANLPYYITTPILFRLFESNADIAAITVMMQKEVADRFCAKPNTKDYNALSVITQYRCDVSYIMKVPRNVFSPKPNVDSAVLQFRFKESDPNIEDDELFALIKACFKQRRKTILNNLSEYLIDKEKARKILNSAGIDLQTRSEQLDLPAFIHLYEVMRK
jgi:16S rRNA (adenine1518-N6/adenine1519-N6)-dimethyltransferase